MNWDTFILEQLESSNSLNFRGLKLAANDIQGIIDSLHCLAPKLGRCRSFSISYNAELRDFGVISLLKALPINLEEIGMVGCGIKNKGGKALIEWINNQQKLKMACIEQNSFSAGMKQEFRKIALERSNLLLMV